MEKKMCAGCNVEVEPTQDGKCPQCGAELVKKETTEGEGQPTAAPTDSPEATS